MSRVCEICGKSYLNANQVPRGVGRRVTRRTSIRQQPNLRVKRFELNGNKVKVTLCTSCLKRIKKETKTEAAN
jgi:ribosomal protein L28